MNSKIQFYKKTGVFINATTHDITFNTDIFNEITLLLKKNSDDMKIITYLLYYQYTMIHNASFSFRITDYIVKTVLGITYKYKKLKIKYDNIIDIQKRILYDDNIDLDNEILYKYNEDDDSIAEKTAADIDDFAALLNRGYVRSINKIK